MIYPWKRYWVKQGENPTMERGLFVEPSGGTRWLGETSNGVALLDLKEVPCLVLLGDVGMGKSTTIWEEAEHLKTTLAGQKHLVLYRDLKRRSETQVERAVFENPEVQAWRQGKHALTLFLDSLDECWRRIDALETLLVEGFERRAQEEMPPLFLRLTCRSAEWRGDAGKTLERLFSKKALSGPPVQIFVLAPLSPSNVRKAARSHNLDGDRLLQRIAAKEAQALASHPITLKMLLQVYQESGDFPRSRVELYRDGCARLCADDQVVFGALHQRKTTPQQRLAIAGRLAALSVFTNRFLINGDLERPLSRGDVLEGTDVLGYTEERVGGASVFVDRDTITEALQTALFAERVEGAQCWRHQSYAEFLAAHYVALRGLSASQIAALLRDTTDNARRIVPQLEETACWMAEMVPKVFAALAEENADVFLRCDSTYWSDHDRALLVGSYLDLVRRHEAPQLDWQLKHRFARLAHPGLAAQLRPVVTNRAEHPLVREVGIDIAGFCKLSVLAPELISTFLDSNDIFRVRKHAANALEQSATDEIRTLLSQKHVTAWTGDVDEELKGYYLRIMWPSHMSVGELLPLLVPSRRNYTGSYKLFLEYELPQSLRDADLPRMLDWLRENNVNFDILGDFGYLPSKVFARAITQMDNPAVRDAVLRLLSFGEEHLHRLFRGGTHPEEMSARVRMCFWKAVVESDLDIQKLVIYGDIRSGRLLLPEDVQAFIVEYRASPEGRVRDRWRSLVFWVFSIEDAAVLETLSSLARTDSAIADALAARTSFPILPDEQNWLKQNYKREQKQKQTEPTGKPSLAQLVLHALDEFEGGHLWAFWQIGELLDFDPENLRDGFVFPEVQVSKAKAWNSLPKDAQQRILHGTAVYLAGQSVNEADVWNKTHRYRPYDVLNPLLVLLFDEEQQALRRLTTEDWSKWVSVFFAYSSRRNGSHDEAYRAILCLAYSKAQPAFLAALKRYLQTEINNDSERRIIWNLDCVWCDEIKELFLDLLVTEPLKTTAAQDIFQLLVSQEPKEAEDLLSAIALKEMERPDGCSVHVPSAIAVLLTSFPTTWGIRLLDRVKAEPALGRAVVSRLVRGFRQPSGWLSKIPAQQLAELWEWLNQQFPGDPFERETGSGEVTIDHEVYHFRNSVFQTWMRAGSPEACGAMVELMRRRPNEFWLGDVLAEMRQTSHRRAWVRPSPSALMQMFAATKVEVMGKSADRQRDFDAFIMSAKGETSTKSFQDWAGGEQVTLAIVFTDVVGSTALGEEIRDEAMNEVRRAHFAQSRKLIGQFQGREIKTIGDSFMAAFKCVGSALDYARALQGNTGDPQVQIRASIHIGPIHVEEGDVFGGTVNFAARVVGTIQGAEIWLSDRAKEDIDRLGAARHKHLKWERHEGVAMKGFPEKFTLWAVTAGRL